MSHDPLERARNQLWLSPRYQPRHPGAKGIDMAEFKDAAAVDEVPAGQGTVVEIEGREIALFNLSGAFYALENTCCHRGGPLGEGELAGSTVTCPWHLWQFDVKTGECRNSPGDRVRSYDVIVENDRVRVKI